MYYTMKTYTFLKECAFFITALFLRAFYDVSHYRIYITLIVGGMFLYIAITDCEGAPGLPLPPLFTASTRNMYSYSSTRFSHLPLKT